MFKGACRLDDPAHRTIILADPRRVNDIPLHFAYFLSYWDSKPLSKSPPLEIGHEVGNLRKLGLILLIHTALSVYIR